ncbi:MAG: hypothetical protein HY606_09920 [Planctomycetes bacterium]|nr:hypothetical protein [Planctomycetota bacterium]
MSFILLTLLLQAQSQNKQELEDLELARTLVANGYIDLADNIFTQLKGSADKITKSQAEAGLISLKIASAGKVKDIEKRIVILKSAVEELKTSVMSNVESDDTFYILIEELMFNYKSLSKYLYDQRKIEEAEQLINDSIKFTSDLIGKIPAGENQEFKIVLCSYFYVNNSVDKMEIFSQIKDPTELENIVKDLKEFMNKHLYIGRETFSAWYSAYFAMGKAINIIASRIQQSEVQRADTLWREALEKFIPLEDDFLVSNVDKPTWKYVILNGAINFSTTTISYLNFLKRLNKRNDYALRLKTALNITENIEKRLDANDDTTITITFNVNRARLLFQGEQASKAKELLNKILTSTSDQKVKQMIMESFDDIEIASPQEIFAIAKQDFDNDNYFQALKKLKQLFTEHPDKKKQAESLYMAAVVYRTLRKYYESLELLTEIEKNYSNFPDILKQTVENKYEVLSLIKQITADPEIDKEFDKTKQFLMSSGYAPITIQREKARGLEEAKKYKECIEAWKEISKDKSSAEESEYNILRITYVLYLRGESATENMIKVVDNYINITSSIENKSKELINRIASAVAIQTSVLVKEGKNQDALSKSEGALTKYEQCKSEYKMSIVSKRLEANCILADYESAKREFLTLDSIFKEAKIMKKIHSASMITLANCAKKLAETISDEKLKSYYNDEFTNYYLRYLDSTSGAADTSSNQEYILNITNFKFKQFENKLPKTIFDKYDETLAEEAKKIRETYESLVDTPEIAKNKQTQAILEYRLGLCSLIEGRLEDAEKYYKKATAPGKFEKDSDLEILKGDILVKKAKALGDKLSADKNKTYDAAIAQYSSILRGKLPNKENEYRALYCSLKALWESGKYEEFKASYNGNEQSLGGIWDDNKFGFKKHFEDLKKNISGHDPRK